MALKAYSPCKGCTMIEWPKGMLRDESKRLEHVYVKATDLQAFAATLRAKVNCPDDPEDLVFEVDDFLQVIEGL